MRKKRILIVVVAFVFCFLFFSFVRSDNTGSVSLVILSGNFEINITNPQNISYDLPRAVSFPMELNVTANQEVAIWRYTLEELTRTRAGGIVLGGNVIVNDQVFTPNTTINAKRFSNKISVSASNLAGEFAYDNVTFFVHVNNTAPQLTVQNLSYVCEGSSANPGFFSDLFFANDTDENDLDVGDSVGGRPVEGGNGIFYQRRLSQSITPYFTLTSARVFSQGLHNRAGNYLINVTVFETDGEPSNLFNKKTINVSVVEMNSRPRIINPLGVQTLWSQGENRTLNYDFNAVDDESGNDESGGLSFNVSFSPNVNLFSITKKGNVSFTANPTQVGIYNVSVCVTDEALPSNRIHPNIVQVCGQDGSNQSDCNLFQLTVTDENRPPKIVSFYPNSTNFNTFSFANYFNVSTEDPDGTIPDVYWYVNGALVKQDSLNSTSELSFVFVGCGVGGFHSVRAVATDGLLNDSVTWIVRVDSSLCSVVSQSGGGGGGGSDCVPDWACDDWDICKRSEFGLSSGSLSGEEYRDVLEQCEKKGYAGDFCGYQRRNCKDVKDCKTKMGMPKESGGCYYTENASCSDGIKNCHDGKCEFLIDCGGPCGACPTCSDGIQNQGEFGIDCGGPCPNICPIEQPLIKVPRLSIYTWLIITISLLIIVGVGIRIYVVWKRARSGF